MMNGDVPGDGTSTDILNGRKRSLEADDDAGLVVGDDAGNLECCDDDDDDILVKIVSASYGPCEGQQLLTGETLTSNEPSAKIPYTRDVTPILRSLLQMTQEEEKRKSQQQQQQGRRMSRPSNKIGTSRKSPTTGQEEGGGGGDDNEDDDDPLVVRLKAIAGGIMGGMKRTSIRIQALHDGGNSMNLVLGDVCPGSSKKLYIHYVILHNRNNKQQAKSSKEETTTSTIVSEVHHVTFAENEPVILRRRVTFYQEDAKLQEATARIVAKNRMHGTDTTSSSDAAAAASTTTTTTPTGMIPDSDVHASSSATVANDDHDDEDQQTLLVARRMGRSQSITEFAQLSLSRSGETNTSSSSSTNDPNDNGDEQQQQQQPITPRRAGRLRSATFEIVLPIVLSFLQIPDRVHCRLVCRLWRNLLSDIGVAAVIDTSSAENRNFFTRSYLRGIISHSYSSLHSLRLSDFHELCPEDLHPSLPHLRKLRVLDVSRCIKLRDETLLRVAQHVSETLEVLYIKGLTNVTDKGMISICRSCNKLKVLEVSHIPITDESGLEIGSRLTNLRALYMRDNYKLTNRSIDAITANCTKLNQLTLWGCIKVKHLSFDQQQQQQRAGADYGATATATEVADDAPPALPYNNNAFSLRQGGKLVSLNLWGCFKLSDDIASALASMKNLRTLVVSECHKLTDEFVISISQDLPQLVHLHLRYCKRLTDRGVNAIASAMNLYSLDLSFCSRVTSQSICALIESRYETLAEIRLQECRQLQISRGPDNNDDDHPGRNNRGTQRAGPDGQAILKALRSPEGLLSSSQSNLSMIDLRRCGGQQQLDSGYPVTDPFVRGMTSLQFEQKTPGFFVRPARWNASMQLRLQEQLESRSAWDICL